MTPIRHAFGVDIGGSELRAAVVTQDGDVVAHRAVPTDARGGPQAVIAQIVALIDTLRPMAGDPPVVGLGLGAPGPLDPEAGIAIAPPTLAGWRDVPLASLLEARLGLPVRIENDANAAALGEWRYGAARGTRSNLFVTVSTGIGGGIIVDGRLLHGRRGLAGEVGHMAIAPDGPRCFCGARGCWEALASGSALGWRATERAAAAEGETLRRLTKGGAVSARHVGEAARIGDPLALALMAEEARWLGLGLVNLMHLVSPERIVIGGGLAACLDLMAAGIAQTIAERAMPPYRDIPIVPAQLGGNAGVVGAASLVL